MSHPEYEAQIHAAFADRSLLGRPEVVEAVRETVALIDAGKVRVAEKTAAGWKVNTWAKEAILLFFAMSEIERMESVALVYQ